MLSFLDGLRGLNFAGVLLRLVLALLCGGALGFQRARQGRSAGLRIHILLCLGGAVASMTGLYLYLVGHLPADVSRIGAQVVSGLGFIGAGTIMVTHRHTVHGLTTAAGLWVSGVIGLAIGAGYYEGGVITAVVVYLVVLLYPLLFRQIPSYERSKLLFRYRDRSLLRTIMNECSAAGVDLMNFSLETEGEGETLRYVAHFTLSSLHAQEREALLERLRAIPGLEEVTLCNDTAERNE